MIVKAMKWLFVIAGSFFFAVFYLTLGRTLTISFLLLSCSLLFFMRFPTSYILFYIIVMSNFGGFIDPNYFLNIPGLFKFKDLFLLCGFFLVFIELFVRRRKIEFDKNSPIIKFLLVLMFFWLINVMRTHFLYDVTLVNAIQYSRRYLFYLSFFFPIFLIQDAKMLKSTIKIFLYLSVVWATLIIIQFILGDRINILGNNVVAAQTLAGIGVTRIYYSGMIFLCLAYSGLAVLCFRQSKQHESKSKNKYVFCLLVIASALFLHFSRMFWFFMLFIILLNYFRNSKNKLATLILLATLTIMVLILLNPKFTNLVLSAITDVLHNEGTFKARMDESWFRFKLISEHPVLGPGFIHPSRLVQLITLSHGERPDLANVDVGWLGIMSDFGVVGVFIFVYFAIKLFRYTNSIMKRTIMNGGRLLEFSSLGQGVGDVVLAGLIISFTNGFYTFEPNIALLGLSLGFVSLIESIVRGRNENCN